MTERQWPLWKVCYFAFFASVLVVVIILMVAVIAAWRDPRSIIGF